MTILDGLLLIKSEFDSSLTFRASCGDGICGSCAISINGVSGLACESLLEDFVDLDGIINLAPLDGMNVIKDLAVDFSCFWNKYILIKPWIISKSFELEKENLISPDELKKFNDVQKCISCGVCYSSCPVLSDNFSFIGPQAITKAFQKVIDIRETNSNSHLANLDSIWNCTTCYQCNMLCPEDIEPGRIGIYLKSKLIENYKLPPLLGNRLMNIYERNNPYGMEHNERYSWLEERKIPNATEQSVQYCLLNCCFSCYDPNAQLVVDNFIEFSSLLPISIGYLGNDEKCCGSEVYRLGEIGLFEFIIEDRQKSIIKIKAKEIICTSPHCYDAYNKQYPKIGIPIKHYTELLAELIDDNRISFINTINKKVTFHDPCYLSKQNNIIAEPRFVLQNIPGIDIIEMEHNKENSLCCGGGGGNIWYEDKNKLSFLRVQEALKTGAEFLVTSCPFCNIQLNDAIIAHNLSDKLKVIDLMQLVLMGLTQR